MSDYEPSDPNGAQPVNRLVPPFDPPPEPSLRQIILEAFDDSQVVAVDLDEEEALFKANDLRGTYRAVYALVRAEMASGQSPKDIGAGVLDLSLEEKEIAEAVAEAVEDALTGRQPKW
jgi:hypothetical protein